MNAKWMTIGIALFVVFIAGMIYLGYQDANKPDQSAEIFAAYAEELGLDRERFITDYSDATVKAIVEAGFAEGEARNVEATPTLFAEGEQLTFRSFKDLTDQLDTFIQNTDERKELPSDVHAKGSTSPKVIIEEFSDFQCPACEQISPYITQLLEKYPDDVAVIYKHFPLPMHPMADEAARAAEAAARQGKFWEMHDLLFERQNDWS